MTATINEPKQSTLYYRQGASDKVYHVSLEPNGSPDRFLVRFAYGRRGATLQTGTKTPAPVDYVTALKAFNNLVAAKTAKGYSPGQDGTPYQHTEAEGRATGIYPQLLEPIEDAHALGRLLIDPNYCAQEKHDGVRLLLRKRGQVLEGINRKGLVVAIPASVEDALRQVQEDFLMDGEAVGDTFHAFDLLEGNDIDYRQQPYAERLNLLFDLLPFGGRAVQQVHTAYTAKDKITLLEGLRRNKREGIVLKSLQAGYSSGRSVDQLKYKFTETASFVVTGVNGAKRSVALGLYAVGQMLPAGNVTIPANHDIPAAGAVVEVSYLYAFRESGSIYQPVYRGVREDIGPADCTTNQLKYKPSA